MASLGTTTVSPDFSSKFSLIPGAKHNFIIAGRQSLHARRTFSKPENDYLISCRDRGKPSRYGNSLEQRCFAFEGIFAGVCDLPKQKIFELLTSFKLTATTGFCTYSFSLFVISSANWVGCLSHSHDVTNDRHRNSSIRTNLDDFRQIHIPPHRDLQYIFGSDNVFAANGIRQFFHDLGWNTAILVHLTCLFALFGGAAELV